MADGLQPAIATSVAARQRDGDAGGQESHGCWMTASIALGHE
jgi:hypothetical protein